MSKPYYVTNPEEISVYKSNGKERGIKERTSDRPDKLLSGELEDLGLNMRHIISGIKDIGRV